MTLCMHASKAMTATAAAVLALVLPGCTASTAAPGTNTTTATAPQSRQAPPPTAWEIALPANYGGYLVPLPPNTNAFIIENTAQIWRLLVTGVDPFTALAFYRTALPDIGFGVDVVLNEPVGFSAGNGAGLTVIVVASSDGTLITVRT